MIKGDHEIQWEVENDNRKLDLSEHFDPSNTVKLIVEDEEYGVLHAKTKVTHVLSDDDQN